MLDKLSDKDRDAVWLRFYEKRTFADVGSKVRLSENAARMRVERAIEQLRALLLKRGIGSTAALLAAILTDQVAGAAPAGLGSAVTGTALAAALGSIGAADTIFMSITKWTIGIISALTLAASSSYMVQQRANHLLKEQGDRLLGQGQMIAKLSDQNQQLTAAVKESDANLGKLLKAVGTFIARTPAIESGKASANRAMVLGAVQKPGFVAISPDAGITVAAAIEKAGGFSDVAFAEQVAVSRIRADGTIENHIVNCGKRKRADPPGTTFQLQAGDVVFIPEHVI
jgi:hypothetical protein